MNLTEDPDWAWRHALFGMLWSRGATAPPFEHPGWSVYRNTTQRACLDGLRANYPALAVLLGEPAFTVLARAYLAAHPPSDARLLRFGQHLPQFLAGFEPAQPWPHLLDVAVLDRAWIESHVAPDAVALCPADLLGPDQIGGQTVCLPHPATRWCYNAERPVASLWSDGRRGLTQQPGLLWQAEGMMLTRRNDAILESRVGLAEVAFLGACAAHLPLEKALEAAWESEPQVDLGALVANMLDRSALTIFNTGG